MYLMLLCLSPMAAYASQLSFDKTTSPTEIQFQYRWTDVQGNEQHIGFTLPRGALNIAPTMQTNYKPEIAQRYVMVSLQQEARKVDPRDAIVSVAQENEKINISVRSKKPDMADKIFAQLKTVQTTAYNDYLDKHYYTRFTTLFNQQAVKPDHLRYVAETYEALRPISEAFYDKIDRIENNRAYLQLLLSWVQSIPYDTLEDRVASNGSGFAPPLGLLMQNRGDCDSKAVLTSALVQAFLPSTSLIMVFLPNHALLGVAINAASEDEKLEVEGKTYVLFDPTGPALIPFGDISEDTKRYISTGRYQVETID
ncbi:hypothetical protein Q4561_01695 [Alteromonas sp. 1_MG-2023]|uniref:hypothetical protein n=1 Tax=Alteromonas sp. 1_MG-2023 TaxID=3062669 RepID=UPI0026E43CE1|nr:hypothetical protein [Alteromonas sp. 1_MG-2023]MDO6565762.1 hypothetical protein [Alteromonas sp. 1_MG-2023]